MVGRDLDHAGVAGTSVAADAGQGVADVRDPRLQQLAQVSESVKVVAATLEVVDLTRLVRGAKRAEGLGGELLAHMRATDAVLLVVRCFDDEQVAHPSGAVDPLNDAETVELELIFADQAAVERRRERIAKTAKSGDKAAAAELTCWQRWRRAGGGPAGTVAGRRAAGGARSADRQAGALHRQRRRDRQLRRRRAAARVRRRARHRGDPDEREAGSRDRRAGRGRPGWVPGRPGRRAAGLDRVSAGRATRALDLIPFFTTGPKETRAWTIRRGQNAQEAAGKIHTDLARGFIRAEVIEWDRLVEAGSEAEAKRRGWVRVEGRDYVVKDGDTLNVRFNV